MIDKFLYYKISITPNITTNDQFLSPFETFDFSSSISESILIALILYNDITHSTARILTPK